MFKYTDVYSKLTYETALVTFLKKDGTIRVMLCTRNLDTAALKYGFMGAILGGHDNRCNVKNGNIAVIDLELGDARSFSIDRVIDIQYSGVVDTVEQLDKCIDSYKEFRQKYEESHSMSLELDTFDGGN